ncbi:unnamed protein product [Ambrosiozyma monospora]|uniref:Unnamed protein product n=1 Tax=Ambrosiozyma monospora TaxID=43982 RepID=A0ACB5SWE0_AMBMO|nr:unnamed protein product [Ambrosiozyma monospora]
MHILKFPWLNHTEENRKFEVYSVSVSPDSKRLASGGLDGKIRIWSIDTLKQYNQSINQVETENDLYKYEVKNALKQYKEPQIEHPRLSPSAGIEMNPDICRPLCSMGRHTGAVTCVRFSPNGRFLASGSDDKILLIWEKDEEKTRIMAQNREQRLQFGVVGDLDSGDLEHWTVRKRLVAHDNDIQDMAWAPDSSILVTVGLDRSIIVWSGNTFEKIKRFDIHQSHVKGVVFDPANKYFATYSDDRTLRVFRYHKPNATEMTFSIESVIIDPFKKTPLTTYFRRCSWSPDGQNIAAPNALNGYLSSVAIIKRGSWESEISLIGHDLPCEVCSFSPRLYQVQAKKKNEPSISTILVTAGQDKTMAIWNTASSTPLVVANDIAQKTITDIAWDLSGQLVFLSSLDGTITSVFFEKGELGDAIPLERNDAQLHRYGVDRESMVFPESVAQLKLEDKAEAEAFKHLPATKHMDRLMNGATTTNNFGSGSAFQEKEKPMAPPTIHTLIPRSKKHPNKKLPTVALQTLKPGSITNTNISSTPSSSSGNSGNSEPPTVSSSSPVPTAIETKKPETKVNVLTVSNQKVTYTKSGKKRVAPMLISTSSPTVGSSGVTKPMVSHGSKLKAKITLS